MRTNYNYISYADKLDQYVENEHLIPYRLHPNARYRNNCYYWISAEEKWFKVEEVQYIFNIGSKPMLDHVQVMWMDKLQAYLCTDLNIYDFRLERDKFGIRGYNTLVNQGISFAGAEIEYWMFKHHITFINEKFKEFWKYIDRNNKYHIEADRYYYIFAEEQNGIYTNVKFILDPSRKKFKR